MNRKYENSIVFNYIDLTAINLHFYILNVFEFIIDLLYHLLILIVEINLVSIIYKTTIITTIKNINDLLIFTKVKIFGTVLILQINFQKLIKSIAVNDKRFILLRK